MTDSNERPAQGSDWGTASGGTEPDAPASGAGGPDWERDAAIRDRAQSGAQGGWTPGQGSGQDSAGPGPGWGASEPGGGDPGGQPSGGQAGGAASGAAASAQQFLGQLQAMIDNIAAQSAPVIREVGAKAAELAAIAAERAGPFAQRAAEKTQEVGARVAERSRTLAEDLRRPEARDEGDASGGTGTGAPDEPEATAPSGPTI